MSIGVLLDGNIICYKELNRIIYSKMINMTEFVAPRRLNNRGVND